MHVVGRPRGSISLRKSSRASLVLAALTTNTSGVRRFACKAIRYAKKFARQNACRVQSSSYSKELSSLGARAAPIACPCRPDVDFDVSATYGVLWPAWQYEVSSSYS